MTSVSPPACFPAPILPRSTLLTQGGFFDARTFDTRNGDLAIGDGVKARNITVSVDGGSLTVNGTVDASGAAPGTIRLSAMNGLTLASSAVLDTHGMVLPVDSYGSTDRRSRGIAGMSSGRCRRDAHFVVRCDHESHHAQWGGLRRRPAERTACR